MKCNQKKVKETVFITAAHIRRAIIPIAIWLDLLKRVRYTLDPINFLANINRVKKKCINMHKKIPFYERSKYMNKST